MSSSILIYLLGWSRKSNEYSSIRLLKLQGGGCMYNVLDICRFIINYCDEKDYNLSNLKLQKILYFVQAYFLCSNETNRPCFAEPIEAWDFGPVVPVAYREYKRFGNTNIPKVVSYIEHDKSNFWNSKVKSFDETVIDESDKAIIRRLVDKFAKYSTTSLVNITHQQTPWKKAYFPGCSNTITHDAIRSYFNG